ncbi:MAG: hypothetical protein ABJF88_11130 [Rhodothermales bacterium]
MSVPDQLAGGSILRAELRIKKKLTQQVGQPVVGGHLGDPAFYRRLGDLWLKHVEQVEFDRLLRITHPATIPELRDSLALQLMESYGGAEALVRAINVAREAGHIDRVQASRQRAWVQKLATHPRLTAEVDVATEFRAAIAAVHQATQAYRSN